MSTNRWIPFLVIILLIGILVRATFLAALAAALLFVLGLSSWWRKHALDEVRYQRKFHYTRGFPGESTSVRVEIENRKLLPLSWLRVQDPWPRAAGPEDDELLAPSHIQDRGFLMNLLSMRWYERVRRTYPLVFRERGLYQVGPVRLESGDLFGIYQQEKTIDLVEKLTVFPKLLPLSALELPSEDPFGDRRSHRRLFEDPNHPMGVREYRPEDGFRRVHWPATARTGQLQVKVYQPVSARVMVVCLNVATFARHWEGVYTELQEHLLSMAATVVSQGIEAGYQVGLVANGCLADSDQPFRILPGRSSPQLTHLLQALAGVSPLVTAPFEQFLLHEVPRIPYGATLVILTAVTSPELGEVLLGLKRHERRVMLFSLAEQAPPSVPGIEVRHLPFQEA